MDPAAISSTTALTVMGRTARHHPTSDVDAVTAIASFVPGPDGGNGSLRPGL